MKRVALFLLAVFLGAQSFIPAALAQEYQVWKFMHPKPQANLLRKIKMLDANIWFAVGGNGTFQRTTDGGASWFLHHQAEPQGRKLSAGEGLSPERRRLFRAGIPFG